ncbi:MAG: hypothetical protein DWQ01_09920 [Planctomycetota bacterium]|nr:MAG: hypothetical protein DWQ01_09920 [Planctomycetota bacterium]
MKAWLCLLLPAALAISMWSGKLDWPLADGWRACRRWWLERRFESANFRSEPLALLREARRLQALDPAHDSVRFAVHRLGVEPPPPASAPLQRAQITLDLVQEGPRQAAEPYGWHLLRATALARSLDRLEGHPEAQEFARRLAHHSLVQLFIAGGGPSAPEGGPERYLEFLALPEPEKLRELDRRLAILAQQLGSD